MEREVVLNAPTDLLTSFRLHRFGGLDPTFQLEANRMRQAVHTPLGPGVFEIQALAGPTRFLVRAHGPGAEYLVERAPRVLGEDDDPRRFVPACAPTRRLVRAVSGLRLTRAASPFGLLVNLIFQQRVAWRDAARAYRLLTRKYGDPAPGEFGLLLPPEPRVWARIPLAEFSALEVDRRRADTIRRAATVAGHVDRLFDEDFGEAERKLASISGLGPWTVQSFLGFALGHADALPTGDYDLPHRVAMVFLGRSRSNDHEMEATLEPYRGQRWRIVRLIEESGLKLVRFAPRRSSGRRR